MRHIVKNPEPQFFIDWKRANGSKEWKKLPTTTRRNVKRKLLEEQGYLCCYCTSRLTMNRNISEIEHFFPKSQNSSFHNRRFDYQNLHAGCKKNGLCGNAKSYTFDLDIQLAQIFLINPQDPACESHFHYRLNGDIEPKIATDQKAEKTIKHLNLDSEYLQKERQEVIEELFGDFGKTEITEEDETFLKQTLWQHTQPDSEGTLGSFTTTILYIANQLGLQI